MSTIQAVIEIVQMLLVEFKIAWQMMENILNITTKYQSKKLSHWSDFHKVGSILLANYDTA